MLNYSKISYKNRTIYAHLRTIVMMVVLLFAMMTAKAQYNMMFTSDYELPNTLVNKVVEDKYGMVWVATEDGLCMFNGSRFITYRQQPNNPNSLANNFVRTVVALDDGNVFAATINGVQMYRPLTRDFTEAFRSEKDGINARNTNDLALTKDGSVLVFGGSCFTLRKSGNQWKPEKNVLTGKIQDAYRGIQTQDGNIWVAMQAQDVLCASPDGKIRKVRSEQGEVINATAFSIGPDGKLYIGTDDMGILVYSNETKAFRHIPGTETLKPVFEMRVMPNSNLLCIATDGMGIKLLDCRTGMFVPSNQFDDPMIVMTSQKVHSVYINKNGDIWSALYQKGVFMTSHAQNVFGYIGHRSAQYDLIGNCCVISLMQAHDGSIWATTDNGGLFGFTSELTSLRKYPSGVKPSGGVPATMLGLYEDSKQRVWYGSYGEGGGLIDLSTGFCQRIPIQGVNDQNYNIYSYAEDKRSQMWVASMGNGILKYDENQKIYVVCKTDDGCQWSNVVFYDKVHDRIYCGTYAGLVSFPATNPKNVTTVAGESVVYAISYVSDSQIAVATNKGLILMDTNTGKYRTVTTEQGLPSDNVYDSKMGNDGHLWISSSSGLTRLDMKNMTTETYTMRDGLQGNEFYKNTGLVTRDGRLLFGGINGITTFQPRDVDNVHNSCQVRVVDLRAGEVYLIPDEDGNYTIPSGFDAFTISFATLPLYMTRRVTYSYSIDGGEWVILAAPQNRVAFDNLGYGNHTLRVKTTVDGKDSEVSETEIYVKYPWFLKWWMVIIWIVLLSTLLYFAYANVQRRRTLRDRLRKHQIEQDLKESKLQFFMNIVHDLRTPLTLIATPLQKLKNSDGDASRQRLYHIMDRNAARLLNLTNEIMDLRKLDRGKMELDLQPTLISNVVREIVGNMEDLALSHRHKLILTDKTDGKHVVMLDYQAFEKILVNLFSNAGKYTPEGGNIEVEWDVQDGEWKKEDGKTIIHNPFVISVTDDGIGISDDEKKRVFERFYQVRIDDKHIKGTGIGLNLVKALVDLYKGEITVTDNPTGKGTRFTVVLPTGQVPDDAVVLEKGNAPVVNVEVDDELLAEEAESVTLPSVEMHEDAPSTEEKQVAAFKSSAERVLLIVDDDDDIRNFLCEELSSMYNVLEASDGKVAYDILNKEKVDLVVSDVMMPEIDGIELTKMIRKNIRISHLPVILLTAKTSDQDRLEGLQTTADAYVTKPFNLELLETLIGNLIMRQDKLRNTFNGNENPADRIVTPEVQSADDKLMERLVKVINENLANPDLTSEMLAREVGLSRVHMYRKLKELTNQSATNFIRNIRLTKAAELLRQGNATVSEIAYLVGFRTPAHFSTAFKELYGVSPKEYMKKEKS